MYVVCQHKSKIWTGEQNGYQGFQLKHGERGKHPYEKMQRHAGSDPIRRAQTQVPRNVPFPRYGAGSLAAQRFIGRVAQFIVFHKK